MNLYPLRPLEQDYKSFYEETSSYRPDTPLELSRFRELVSASSETYSHLIFNDLCEELGEETYFEDRADISALLAYRYMPGIWHRHAFFELACVLSGTYENFIGAQHFSLKAGDILILAPEIKHAVCSCSDDAIMVNILIRAATFENNFMGILPDNDLLRSFFVRTLYHSQSTPYLLFQTGTDPVISEGILQILEEDTQSKRYKDTMLRSLISLLFINLLRTHEKDVIVPGSGSPMLGENTIFILQYMQENYSTITLSHLARFFNYSERQMQRIITAATGKSFVANIRELRMGHAAEMLCSTNLSIGDIAEHLGFFDASNFRHHFKAYYHMTPQEYRAAHKS